MNLLLDTSVLIDALRARNRRREFLAELVRAGHSLFTTTLNIAEVYAGMRPGEESGTELLLAGLKAHDLNGSAARLGGKIKAAWQRKGRTLGLADTIIAAIAIESGSALVTDNRRDFPMTELKLYPMP